MIKKPTSSGFSLKPIRRLYLILCCSVLSLQGQSQKPKAYLASESFNDMERAEQRFRVLFYNVENLFDYFEDSLTLDDEFLPRGARFWTKARYETKQNSLAKTIIATGGWEAPALVGLCEVENRYVLSSLTQFTALQSAGYEIIHQDSPDRRGIDVAALYRPDKFKLVDYEYYPLKFPFDTASRTRDMLHVVGQLPNQDTLHFFVNHWPSKYGGEFETEPKRMHAARLLRRKVDSLLRLNPSASIILSGDFNDEPDAASVMEGLRIQTSLSEVKRTDLYNLMYPIRFLTGTHSFQNRWSILDQFIVSSSLMDPKHKTSIAKKTAQIFDMPFLIMEGATGATRPFRTYQGPRYLGGYSDHLPIIVDLVLKTTRF